MGFFLNSKSRQERIRDMTEMDGYIVIKERKVSKGDYLFGVGEEAPDKIELVNIVGDRIQTKLVYSEGKIKQEYHVDGLAEILRSGAGVLSES